MTCTKKSLQFSLLVSTKLCLFYEGRDDVVSHIIILKLLDSKRSLKGSNDGACV
jgi:hypothetical protein